MSALEKKYILKNNSNSDLYLQDFNPVIVIKAGQPSKKQFSATEINASQDINIFISNGLIDAVEVSETEGQLVNGQINQIRANAPKAAIKRDFRRDGIDVRDGIVSSMGTEDMGLGLVLIPGTRVRLRGAGSLTGILGQYSEKMSRWAINLNDGRVAYALERDIIDLDLGVSSNNIEGERSIVYADDVLKRGIVAKGDQMQRSTTLRAGDVISRASKGQPTINMSGKPVDDGIGGRFSAAEVLARPLVNDGGNVEIVSPQGQVVPNRRPEMEDQGTIIMDAGDGMAEEVPLGKVVQDTGKVMGEKLGHAVRLEAAQKKTKYQLKKERKMKREGKTLDSSKKHLPVNPVDDSVNTVSAKELAEFFSKPLHIQKFGISKMKDVNKLKAIAENATDDNIAMMAMERIDQLSN